MSNREKIQSLLEDLIRAGIRIHFVKAKKGRREASETGRVVVALDENKIIISPSQEKSDRYLVTNYHKHAAELDFKPVEGRGIINNRLGINNVFSDGIITVYDLANGFGYWVYHHYPHKTEEDSRILSERGEEFDIKHLISFEPTK